MRFLRKLHSFRKLNKIRLALLCEAVSEGYPARRTMELTQPPSRIVWLASAVAESQVIGVKYIKAVKVDLLQSLRLSAR